MSSSKRLIEWSLEEFSGAVSRAGSTPAAGSVAAATGALGASLAAMVTRITAAHQDNGQRAYLEGRAEELEDLVTCLLELVDRDAEAWRALVRLERSRTAPGAPEVPGVAASPWTDAERAVVTEAFEAPMEIAEFSLAALRLLAAGRDRVPVPIAADFQVAGQSLLAGVEGGLAVAEGNLPGLAEVPGPGSEAGVWAEDLKATLAAVRAEALRIRRDWAVRA